MANPAVTSRGTPAGAALDRGFKCKFTFGLLPTFSMWEFEITPGKLKGGPPIMRSTFFNNYVHTKVPQVLVDQDPFIIRGIYDPDIWKSDGTYTPSVTNQLRSLMNRNGALTFLMPNLGTLNNYGWLREVDLGTFKEGDTLPPTITLTVEVSNFDPVNRAECHWYYVDGYTGTADSV